MINKDTKSLYQYLYPRGINLLAFAFWWHYYAPPDWYHEHPADEIIQDAFEAWARTLPTPELGTPTDAPYVSPSSNQQQTEEQHNTPTGAQVLAYARNVYGKPWRMDADTALAIDEYLETGDIPHRAPFLLAQLIDDIVSILTWRNAPPAELEHERRSR